MKRAVLRIVVGLAALLVAGYLYWSHQQTKASAKLRSIEVKQTLASSPRSKVFELPEGQMIVVQVPVPDITVPNFGETRHCFVWRDAATRMSSMSCDQRPDFFVDEK